MKYGKRLLYSIFMMFSLIFLFIYVKLDRYEKKDSSSYFF